MEDTKQEIEPELDIGIMDEYELRAYNYRRKQGYLSGLKKAVEIVKTIFIRDDVCAPCPIELKLVKALEKEMEGKK